MINCMNQLVNQKPWKLKDILDTDCTSQKDNFLKVVRQMHACMPSLAAPYLVLNA